jgi:hypothetical protein
LDLLVGAQGFDRIVKAYGHIKQGFWGADSRQHQAQQECIRSALDNCQVPQVAIDLLLGMVHPVKEQRLGIKEVKGHAAWHGFDWASVYKPKEWLRKWAASK